MARGCLQEVNAGVRCRCRCKRPVCSWLAARTGGVPDYAATKFARCMPPEKAYSAADDAARPFPRRQNTPGNRKILQTVARNDGTVLTGRGGPRRQTKNFSRSRSDCRRDPLARLLHKRGSAAHVTKRCRSISTSPIISCPRTNSRRLARPADRAASRSILRAETRGQASPL